MAAINTIDGLDPDVTMDGDEWSGMRCELNSLDTPIRKHQLGFVDKHIDS